MGPLGELGALFNPGMRHEIEERQAKANRREEEGNARDGDLRIDLASGVAVINLSGNSDHPAAPARNEAGDQHSETVADGAADRVETADDAGAADRAGAVDDGSAPDRAHAADDAGRVDDGARSQDENTAGPVVRDTASPAATSDGKPLTAAQVRRLAAAARRSAGGDQPARVVPPRPANAQRPSSKASRAAR